MPSSERAHTVRDQQEQALFELSQADTHGPRLLSGRAAPRGLVPRIPPGGQERSPGQQRALLPNLTGQSLSGEAAPGVGTQLSESLLRAGMSQVTPEAGSGLIVVSQPQEPQGQTLFAGSATLPDGVIPENHIITESPTGLAIVTQMRRKPDTSVTAEDMPKTHDEDEREISFKKEQVPLFVWMTAPTGALKRLASETENKTILRVLDESEETGNDRHATPESLYGEEQKNTIYKDADTFFAATVEDTHKLAGSTAYASVMTHLITLADRIRAQTDSEKLPGGMTVEAVARSFQDSYLVSPAALDLLTRFDIPRTLSNDLFSQMDRTHQLSHPLAKQLQEKLPDGHPFKQETVLPWAAAPDETFKSLAGESENVTASALIEAANTQQETLMSAVVKHNGDPQVTLLQSMLQSDIARRLALQDFTETEVEEINGMGYEYPADISSTKLKMLVPDTILEEIPKEGYTEEQKMRMQQEADRFFATALIESKTLYGTKHEEAIISRIREYADILRLQTKSVQLSGEKTVAAILSATENQQLTPEILSLLTRFTITPENSAELLSRLDNQGTLTHPLALHMMDNLTADHPFKLEQQRRVDRLTELLTSTITAEELDEALLLRDRIISVYVNPDSDPARDKVGLEFENFPMIKGITVPDGTIMGQDTDGPTGIPELRLEDTTDILMYGSSWRQRYFNLLLWTQLTQAEQRSLHLHVNRNDNTRPELYKLIFGLDFEQVKENNLGTMEVRTTLKDYQKEDVSKEGIIGFSSLYMPALVDLMYSMRSASFTPANLSDIQQDRFGFFTRTVSDPLARAALLVALRGEAGYRVLNPEKDYNFLDDDIVTGGAFKIDGQFNAFTAPSQKKLLTSLLDQHDPHYNEYIAGNIENIDESLHAIVITRLLAANEKETLFKLTSKIALLKDIRLQNRVAGMALTKYDEATVRELAKHITALEDPQMQTRAARYILKNASVITIEDLIANTGSLEPDMQREVITDTLDKKRSTSLLALGGILPTLDPEVLEGFVTETFDQKDRHRIMILGAGIGSLDISYQKRFIEFLEEKKNTYGISLVGEAVDKIDKSLHVRAAKLALSVNNGAINGLIKHIGIFDETTQKDIVDTAHKGNMGGSIALLGEHIDAIDQSLHETVINKIIETENGIKFLASSLDSIDPKFHQKIADAAFDSNDASTIKSLLEHINSADIAIQKRYVDLAIDSNDTLYLLYASAAINLFDPTLQKLLISHADDNAIIQFFDMVAQRIELIDPVLQNQVATFIALDGSDEALIAIGDKFHLISPAARATLTPYLERYHSELYRANSMNVPGWKYPNAA